MHIPYAFRCPEWEDVDCSALCVSKGGNILRPYVLEASWPEVDIQKAPGGQEQSRAIPRRVSQACSSRPACAGLTPTLSLPWPSLQRTDPAGPLLLSLQAYRHLQISIVQLGCGRLLSRDLWWRMRSVLKHKVARQMFKDRLTYQHIKHILWIQKVECTRVERVFWFRSRKPGSSLPIAGNVKS